MLNGLTLNGQHPSFSMYETLICSSDDTLIRCSNRDITVCHYRSQDVVDPAVHRRRVPAHISRDRAAGAAGGAEPPGVVKAADLPNERHRAHGIPHVRLRGVGTTRAGSTVLCAIVIKSPHSLTT